jgi:hypothetical protein
MDVSIYRSAQYAAGTTGGSWHYSLEPVDAEPPYRAGSGEEPYGSIGLPDGARVERDRDNGQLAVLVRQGGPGSGFLKYTAAEAVAAAKRGHEPLRVLSGLGSDDAPPAAGKAQAARAPGKGKKEEEVPGPTITYPVGDLPELTPPGTSDADRERVGTNLAALARAYIEQTYPGSKAVVSYQPGDAGTGRKGGKVEAPNDAALGGLDKEDLLDDVDRFVRRNARNPELREATFDAAAFVHRSKPEAAPKQSGKGTYRDESKPGGTDARSAVKYRLHEVDDSPDDRVQFVAVDPQGEVRGAFDEEGVPVAGATTVKDDYDLGKALGSFDPQDIDAMQKLIAGGGKKKAAAKKDEPKKDDGKKG